VIVQVPELQNAQILTYGTNGEIYDQGVSR
jgi:hypothetical protein